MSIQKEKMCPLFPDMVCPQGTEYAQSCSVRLHSDYDPMRDFKDYAFMNCAVRQARAEQEKQNGNKQD